MEKAQLHATSFWSNSNSWTHGLFPPHGEIATHTGRNRGSWHRLPNPAVRKWAQGLDSFTNLTGRLRARPSLLGSRNNFFTKLKPTVKPCFVGASFILSNSSDFKRLDLKSKNCIVLFPQSERWIHHIIPITNRKWSSNWSWWHLSAASPFWGQSCQVLSRRRC